MIPSTSPFSIVLKPVYEATVSSPRVTVTLYSRGEAGDHSSTLSTWKVNGVSVLPDPEPISPDSACTVTFTSVWDLSDECTVTLTAIISICTRYSLVEET